MITWLSTTQHKINATIAVALILALGVFAFREYSRSKSDATVQAAAKRALRATVADSVTQRILKPRIDSLQKEIDALKTFQQQQRIKNNLLAQRNENLYKQIDSVNAILGLRPDF